MKKAFNALLGMVFVASAVATYPALADEAYYIEIGKDVADADVDKEWQALVAKYKPQLKDLKLFPKSVIEDGQAVGKRLQAGPIANKAKAQKICSKLFAGDVACFVIEGVDGKPPKEMMNLSASSVRVIQLPWATNSNVHLPEQGMDAAPLPVKEESNALLPWLLGDDKNTEAAERAPEEKLATPQVPKATEASRKADVHVDEAIRVPLTNNFAMPSDAPVSVKTLPLQRKPFSIRQAKDEPYPTGSKTSGAGWLTVGVFPNQEIAMSFWEEARASAKGKANSLHVKVVKSLMQQDQKTSIGIGPFSNSNDAYAFCRDAIQSNAKGLSCTFGSDVGAPATGQAQGEGVRHRFMENPPLPSKLYWVQVVSADSQMDALAAWDKLKTDNDDLLGKLRSSVSPSPTGEGQYTVRVGPIVKNDDAVDLCKNLQERNVNCRVLLFTTGH